jgi:hypothetical protein
VKFDKSLIRVRHETCLCEAIAIGPENEWSIKRKMTVMAHFVLEACRKSNVAGSGKTSILTPSQKPVCPTPCNRENKNCTETVRRSGGLLRLFVLIVL